MNTWSVILILACSFYLNSVNCFAQSSPASNESDEEKAVIMEVIQRESAAFWEKDFEKWSDCWVHEPYVRVMGWWEAGGISVTEGWNSLSSSMKKLMEDNPQPNPTAELLRRDNINMRILGNMAMVTFNQHGLDTGDKRMDMPGLSYETRVLEKQDGNWKIIYSGWLLAGEQKQ